METIQEAVKETNKKIRATLKIKFKNTRFSVKLTSGGSSRISWTNGPSRQEVKDTVKQFEGCTFDSMSDLASPIYRMEAGTRIHSGIRYIFTDRATSEAA